MLTLYEPFEKWMERVAWPKWGKLELPLMNVHDGEKIFVVTAEAAGFAPEEVKVSVEGNTLTIVGRHEAAGEEEGKSFRRCKEFRKTFHFPTNVNADAIKAKMADGLLTIELPKVEGAGKKAIAVEVEHPKLGKKEVKKSKKEREAA